jgi:hypothetical protein
MGKKKIPNLTEEEKLFIEESKPDESVLEKILTEDHSSASDIVPDILDQTTSFPINESTIMPKPEDIHIIEEVNNEDSLAVTPQEKQSFLSELIKKPIDTPPSDFVWGPDKKVDISSSSVPKSAVHYARRNVETIKKDILETIKPSPYDSAVNNESRGIFKARPDKPIKNV